MICPIHFYSPSFSFGRWECRTFLELPYACTTRWQRKKNRRVRSIDSHLRLLTVPCTSFLFRLSHYLPISGRKNCCSFLQVIEQVSFFSLQQVRRSYLVVFIVIKYLTFGFLFTFMIIMMDPLSSGLPLNE